MRTNYIVQIAILLVSITAVFTYNCDIYRCASTTSWYLDPNTCVGYHKNELANIKYFEIDMSHCKKPKFCPLALVGNEYSLGCFDPVPHDDRNEPTKGLDTDVCDRDLDCKSGNCSKDKKCIGRATGDACSNNNQCKIGGYCKEVQEGTTQCQPQEEDGKACLADTDCLNNSGCLNKVCIKYYSLKDNINVFKPEDKRFCESNFERDNICVSHKLLSADECIGSQENCEYSYVSPTKTDPIKFTQKCRCSPGHYDKMFCPLGGDSYKWKEMVPVYKYYYDNVAMKKHTVLRDFFTQDVLLKQFETEKYPQFKDADKCYKELMTGGFYNSIKYGLLALFSVVIFMF